MSFQAVIVIRYYAYIPLNRKYMGNRTLFLSPSNEIFIQTGKHIVLNSLEENRLYNAIGYPYNNLIYTLGHMWTYGQQSSGYEYRTRHVIRAGFYLNVDFRKNKLRPRLID